MHMSVSRENIETLRREKYAGNPNTYMSADIARLSGGEPLAYVIGNQPFLGLSIDLSSRPLIPRSETEWWTELLIQHLLTDMICHISQETQGCTQQRIQVLDLCAGSGAIGLSVLSHCKNTHVSFGEIEKTHVETIQKNIKQNVLDALRAKVHFGDLFEPFEGRKFHIIATNPPYVPQDRILDESVTGYEPARALYGGREGLDYILKILQEAPYHFYPNGQLWMECDISNIEKARQAAHQNSAIHTEIHTDPYGRPRLLVAYY